MRKAIEKIDRKLYICNIGEITEWKAGYIAGLEYAKELINDAIDDLIVLGGRYFVIVYKDGNEFMPSIQEMKLYKITGNKRKSYSFSRNLNANVINTPKADVVIMSGKNFRQRVFFTREQAEKVFNKIDGKNREIR